MELTAFDQASVFGTLKSEWNALLQRSHTDTIFLTWEWQSGWWSAYDPGQLWVIACRDDDGRLVGIAPWFIEDDGRERVVRTVGCVDVTDYVDIIADPAYRERVYQMLVTHLRDRRADYDRINLCNIPETSPTRELFAAILRGCGFEVEIEFQEVCPVIRLPADFETYLGNLDKKQRHEIRRKLRRAEGQPTLDWYIVGPEHDLDAELDRFLRLMAASHPEKAAFLAHYDNRRFFQTIVPETYRQGWLQLAFLCFHGEAVAAYLNFDYRGRILVYNSGLLPEAYGHFSPGIVLLAYLIRHAIETQREVFDFLRGDETYKYRMGAEDTRVYKLKARLA